jgi:hypothetical protein
LLNLPLCYLPPIDRFSALQRTLRSRRIGVHAPQLCIRLAVMCHLFTARGSFGAPYRAPQVISEECQHPLCRSAGSPLSFSSFVVRLRLVCFGLFPSLLRFAARDYRTTDLSKRN